MKIKDRAKSKLPPVRPGVYFGICIGVIDLGEQYSERFKNYRNEVQFIWELSGETIEVDGELRPRQLSRVFSIATGKKSNLRAFLSSWNGVQYTDKQFQELELFDQIGTCCQLNVVLNDTGEYANVDSAIPLPKGVSVPKTETKPILWDMEQWDGFVFDSFPEWIREKIMKSTQYQKLHPPTDTVDFPEPVPESSQVEQETAPQLAMTDPATSDTASRCPF